jgi:hypothetical protein
MATQGPWPTKPQPWPEKPQPWKGGGDPDGGAVPKPGD